MSLSVSALNAACNAIVDLLDGGAGSYPTIKVRTSANALVATINLGTPAFGPASNGAASCSAPVSGGGSWSTFSQPVSSAGNIEGGKAQFCDKDGNVVFDMDVVASGPGFVVDDFVLESNSLLKTTVAPSYACANGS